MNEDINMDKIFREKLEGHSVEPSAHLWDGIKIQMAAKRKRRRIAYISRIAAAAVIVFAFLAGWYFNDRSGSIMPETAHRNVVKEESTQEEVISEISPNLNDKSIDRKDLDPINSTKPVKKEEEFYTGEMMVAKNQYSNNKEERDIADYVREQIRMKILDNLNANFSNDKNARLALHNVPVKTKSEFSNTEQLLIAGNINSNTDTKEKNAGWKMGLNIAPGYSSYKSDYTNSYIQNMTYDGSEGRGDISGGISVQYKTGSRWSIESGVYYAQNTQASINTPQLYAYSGGNGFDQLTSPNEGERYYFNTTLKVQDNKAVMNSTAGVIEFNDLPKGAEVAASPEVSGFYSDALLTSGEFSQVFDFIEIPLYLRYMILESNFDIELIGGINAGLVVGNNAYMKNEDGVQNIGETKDVSSLNMSGTFGLGINYSLGRHISLAVEPRLNYYLNSINNNPDVDYRPYRIGVYTGVYYEF